MFHSILVVDDSIALTQFLERKLTESFPNVRIQVVRFAGEGYYNAVGQRPDLVLVDYSLPDMKGDEVCRLLYNNPVTAQTPVILFYGNGVDVARIQTANPNMVASLQKPFRTEELIDEVTKVFSKPRVMVVNQSDNAVYKDLGMGSSKILFRANTSLFPLAAALRHIDDEQLSGVLRVLMKKHPVEIYCLEGKVCLATTKDVHLYSLDSPMLLSHIERDTLATAAKGQMDSGCPHFILLGLKGAIHASDVLPMVESHGTRLGGHAFLATKTTFEFEDLNSLPEFVGEHAQNAVEATRWGFECLRQIPDDRISLVAPYDFHDTPAYSPASFLLLKKLSLDPLEARFAGEIDSVTSLESLAEKLGLNRRELAALTFRFASFGILDLWPASVFGE